MALLDLLGQRWVLRILWELKETPLTFRALQEACDQVSPSVLNARLKSLREADLLHLTDDGYALTGQCKTMLANFMPLVAWSDAWADALKKNTKDQKQK
ncbi:MAG: helix-turn-helix domain-containing protein [Parvibaculum sp.]